MTIVQEEDPVFSVGRSIHQAGNAVSLSGERELSTCPPLRTGDGYDQLALDPTTLTPPAVVDCDLEL